MAGFWCPKCQMVRHTERASTSSSTALACGTLVPDTAEEIAQFRADSADDPDFWPGPKESGPE